MSTGIIINGGASNGGGASYKAIIAWDGVSVPVVANIPAGVTVVYQGTSYTGTLVASSATKKYVYLIKTGSGIDLYDEYKTYKDQNGNWFWEKGGFCRIDLTEYLKYTQQILTEAQKAQARLNIGAIALSEVPIEIFTAIYNSADPTQSTTYAEIMTAYTAGKLIQVKVGFEYYALKSAESNKFCFTGLNPDGTAKKFVCGENGWETPVSIQFLTEHQSLASLVTKVSYESDSEVIAAAFADIYARLNALEYKLSPNGNLGKVNVDVLSVIKTFNNYTV